MLHVECVAVFAARVFQEDFAIDMATPPSMCKAENDYDRNISS